MPARARVDLTAREVCAVRAALAHALDSDNAADDVALYRVGDKLQRAAADKFPRPADERKP